MGLWRAAVRHLGSEVIAGHFVAASDQGQAGGGVFPLAGVAQLERDTARQQHRVAPRVAGYAGGERTAGIGQQQWLTQVAAGDPGIGGGGGGPDNCVGIPVGGVAEAAREHGRPHHAVRSAPS